MSGFTRFQCARSFVRFTPSLTMPSHVTPPSLMDTLKVGQKITFETNEGHGLPEITAIGKR